MPRAPRQLQSTAGTTVAAVDDRSPEPIGVIAEPAEPFLAAAQAMEPITLEHYPPYKLAADNRLKLRARRDELAAAAAEMNQRPRLRGLLKSVAELVVGVEQPPADVLLYDVQEAQKLEAEFRTVDAALREQERLLIILRGDASRFICRHAAFRGAELLRLQAMAAQNLQDATTMLARFRANLVDAGVELVEPLVVIPLPPQVVNGSESFSAIASFLDRCRERGVIE